MKKSSHLKVVSLALLCVARFATAADHTVTSNLNEGEGTLRNLVAAAGQEDRILIPEGMVITITERISIGGKSLTLEGEGGGATITGGGTNTLIRWEAGGRTLKCNNLTFSNGHALSGDGGGAIWLGWSTGIMLSNCTFVGNSALGRRGGAIYHQNNWADLKAIDCRFINNTAKEGGAYSGWAMFGYTFDNCTFDSNTATSQGGAIYGSYMTNNFNSASPGLAVNCTFTNNTASQGGVIYSAFATQTFEDCLITDNRATSNGGVLYQAGGAGKTVVFRRCRVQANEGVGGGTIYSNNGQVYMYDSIFRLPDPVGKWLGTFCCATPFDRRFSCLFPGDEIRFD